MSIHSLNNVNNTTLEELNLKKQESISTRKYFLAIITLPSGVCI